ncbi:MAG: SoxR reducing system RseC family protein, partial [Pseudomonadota bacterium]
SRQTCKGCNGQCLGLASGEKIVRLPRSIVESVAHVQVGDELQLSLPRPMLMSLSSLVYLLPVVLMLLFAIACQFLFGGSEAATVLAALIGLGAGFVVCHIAAKRLAPAISEQISVACDP